MNKLTLLNVIGRGSFGAVYKGVYRGSSVAAKVIQVSDSNKDTRKAIQRESNVLRLLSNSYVLIMNVHRNVG